jgi:hypothetical protein
MGTPGLAPTRPAPLSCCCFASGARDIQKKLRRLVRLEAARPAERGFTRRLLFEEEARCGRRREPRRAGVPAGGHPLVGPRSERQYSYAEAAVSPPDGTLVSLVLAEVNAELMSLFPAEVARRYARTFILLVLDGAGWQRAGNLGVPTDRRLEPLPARGPELNPAEHRGEEMREKWWRNQLFLQQSAVERPVEKGWAAWERDPQRVASLAGFTWLQQIPLIALSHYSSFDRDFV